MTKIIYIFLCTLLPAKHAEIATKQAVLETGWFKSAAFKNKNNPFGLMKGGELREFESIEEACQAYKDLIYYKYDGGDYYEFLDEMGYAEDPNYIWKLKHIKLKLDKEL